MGVMLLAGCAGSSGGDQNDRPENAKENSKEDKEEKKKKSKKKKDEQTVDLTSEEGIISYLAGDWTLFDRETGEDYGTLSIQKDGSFDFTRLSDKAKGSGTLSFECSRSKKGEEPDWFVMDLDDCKDLMPKGTELYGNEGTGGIFHVGTFGNEDYLYLKEVGNGDSVVSMYVFNTAEDSDEIGDWSYDWLFYRDNDTENPADIIEDETFYAWAWETDEDGVWLQPMNKHEYETQEEYSDRKYLGGYFNETDNIGVAHYGISKDTDLGDLYDTKSWDSGYPLMMCEVTIDGKGDVKKLRDVDIMMYSSYYMGDIEPEYSYKDMTFTINGFDIDITQFAPDATAIMDAKHVGDWIIIECHNNPNISTYLFYNVCDGINDYFEYRVDGANLIWQGDDLSTAVYQLYNDIYDIWGHYIGHIQDGELYDLSFAGRNTIVAKCWIVDEIGREKEFTQEFEYEPCDQAVWAYYEYMLGGASRWRRFADMADGASAFIIVDPPERILDRMPYPVEYEKGALDKVAVVSLADDAEVFIRPLESASGRSEKFELQKGCVKVFDVTAPEGMPIAEVVVSSDMAGDATWEIGQLSGRNPQMSTFIK